MSAYLYYDQPYTLLAHVAYTIAQNHASSLLDIGAGHPAKAVPLAGEVDSYLGIEMDEEQCERLRQVNVSVRCGAFPATAPEDGAQYDCVLSSHSVPEGDISVYEPFLTAAWSFVKLAGYLHIITFKGSRMAQHDLREELTGSRGGDDEQYTEMMRLLETLSPEIEMKVVTSHYYTDELETLAARIEPLILRTENEREQHGEALRRILAERYRGSDGEYIFPTKHLSIIARK